MTYYEELGLKPDAAPEEIRQAYRSLARLLHPDQQGDDDLRRLAENQMKRLNSVHDTLADPVRRQHYDASLVQGGALANLASPQAIRRFSAHRDVGFLVVGMAVASVCWLLTTVPAPRAHTERPPGTGPQSAAGAASAATATRLRRSPAKPQPRVRTPANEEEASAGHDEPARAATLESGAEPLAEPVVRALAPEPVSPAATAIQAPLPAPVEQQPAGVAQRFAGTWLYVRPKVPPSEKSLYPADYIEAVIVEDSGVLRGRYSARYEVPDRPISSEVTFRFEGKAQNDLANLIWTGAGGSEGELKLSLLSRDSMKLDWIATALGTQLGLASGTAVLVRRQGR